MKYEFTTVLQRQSDSWNSVGLRKIGGGGGEDCENWLLFGCTLKKNTHRIFKNVDYYVTLLDRMVQE